MKRRTQIAITAAATLLSLSSFASGWGNYYQDDGYYNNSPAWNSSSMNPQMMQQHHAQMQNKMQQRHGQMHSQQGMHSMMGKGCNHSQKMKNMKEHKQKMESLMVSIDASLKELVELQRNKKF